MAVVGDRLGRVGVTAGLAAVIDDFPAAGAWAAGLAAAEAAGLTDATAAFLSVPTAVLPIVSVPTFAGRRTGLADAFFTAGRRTIKALRARLIASASNVLVALLALMRSVLSLSSSSFDERFNDFASSCTRMANDRDCVTA